jgi:hypothetical protein
MIPMLAYNPTQPWRTAVKRGSGGMGHSEHGLPNKVDLCPRGLLNV